MRPACTSLPLLSELFDAGTITRLLIPKLIARERQNLCAGLKLTLIHAAAWESDCQIPHEWLQTRSGGTSARKLGHSFCGAQAAHYDVSPNVIASRLWQLRLPQCRKYACMQSISTGQGLSSGQIKPWVAWSYLQPPIPVLVVQLLQPLVVGLCVPALRGHIRDHENLPLVLPHDVLLPVNILSNLQRCHPSECSPPYKAPRACL